MNNSYSCEFIFGTKINVKPNDERIILEYYSHESPKTQLIFAKNYVVSNNINKPFNIQKITTEERMSLINKAIDYGYNFIESDEIEINGWTFTETITNNNQRFYVAKFKEHLAQLFIVDGIHGNTTSVDKNKMNQIEENALKKLETILGQRIEFSNGLIAELDDSFKPEWMLINW
jgi:hypothetical protein